MLATLRVNWVILRTCIEERLVYRADFAFGTLIRFLPIVTQIFLWGAIYGVHRSETHVELNSYRYEDMVAYYLLAMVGRAFSSMPGLADGVALSVRDGSIKKFLTQPIDMLGYLFWHRVAHKLVYYFVATAPFAFVFYLCGDYFPGWPPASRIVAFVLSLIMAFLVGFLIEALIGLLAFWFLEISSLLFIYMMFNFFLSGHMMPLDWFPPSISQWMLYLPFKYLAYFPAAIMLNLPDGTPRIPDSQLYVELGIEFLWIIGLLILNRIAFQRGVKRYGAFGG